MVVGKMTQDLFAAHLAFGDDKGMRFFKCGPRNDNDLFVVVSPEVGVSFRDADNLKRSALPQRLQRATL